MNRGVFGFGLLFGAVYFGTKLGLVMAQRGLSPLSEDGLRAAWRLVLLDLAGLMDWLQALLRMAS